jgi:hypothetical protein
MGPLYRQQEYSYDLLAIKYSQKTKLIVIIIWDNPGKDFTCQLRFHQTVIPYYKVITLWIYAHTAEDHRGFSHRNVKYAQERKQYPIRINNRPKNDMIT